MANAPIQFCPTPGCLTLTRGGPCPPCAQVRRARKGRRPSRHVRGYGYRWEKLRHQALQRDGERCTECGAPGREVDHIMPRREFEDPADADFLENLQTLCKTHHSRKTMHETDQLGQRRR